MLAEDGTVTTLAGHYEVETTTESVGIVGAAYERPDMALRGKLFINQIRRLMPTKSSFHH